MRIYFFVASVAWSPNIGWYTPPLLTTVAVIFTMMTHIGTMMEDPFGNDSVDLPMHIYCGAIEMQVQAIKSRRLDKYEDEEGGTFPREGFTDTTGDPRISMMLQKAPGSRWNVHLPATRRQSIW